MHNKKMVGQAAICVTDWQRSANFYEELFGWDHVFGTNSFRGELPEQVQGMKNCASSTRWLIDDNVGFQFEIFQFENPQPKPLREDHNITDIGYNRWIIAVKSMEKILAKAANMSVDITPMNTGGSTDKPAHAYLHDPDGILLELVELPDMVMGNHSSQLVATGITTPNLDLSIEDMSQGFGFTVCDVDPFEHNRYWAEDDRLERHQTLKLGNHYLVISQYSECRPRPEGYQLCDVGIMNFALFFPDKQELRALYDHTHKMGMRANCEPIVLGDNAVFYHNDRQGFSVECGVCTMWGLYGFSTPTLKDRLLNRFLQWRAHRAYTPD